MLNKTVAAILVIGVMLASMTAIAGANGDKKPLIPTDPWPVPTLEEARQMVAELKANPVEPIEVPWVRPFERPAGLSSKSGQSTTRGNYYTFAMDWSETQSYSGVDGLVKGWNFPYYQNWENANEHILQSLLLKQQKGIEGWDPYVEMGLIAYAGDPQSRVWVFTCIIDSSRGIHECPILRRQVNRGHWQHFALTNYGGPQTVFFWRDHDAGMDWQLLAAYDYGYIYNWAQWQNEDCIWPNPGTPTHMGYNGVFAAGTRNTYTGGSDQWDDIGYSYQDPRRYYDPNGPVILDYVGTYNDGDVYWYAYIE